MAKAPSEVVYDKASKRWEYRIDGEVAFTMSERLEVNEENQEKRRRGRPTKEETQAKIEAERKKEEEARQAMETEIERRVNARIAEWSFQHQIEEELGSENMRSLMSIFLAGTQAQITQAMREAQGKAISDLETYLELLKEEIVARQPLLMLNEHGEAEPFVEQTHMCFTTLMAALRTNFPVMMVGPAGSGKTYAAAQAARALNLSFYAISVGSQTSKIDLLGYLNANGDYVSTQFRQAYEHGGIFLMDEIDAGNPNVLIVLNSALSSDTCAFPDGMVPRHQNFLFIGTANTYGMGANRQYVGRNQIDAATLDRFVTVDWPIDEGMERSMVAHLEQGERWHQTVIAMRKVASDNEMRIVISPRATLKGALLLDAGMDVEKVLTMCVLATAGADQSEQLAKVAQQTWKG